MLTRLWLSGLVVLTAGAALADFEGDMRDAGALCKANKHEEAVQAYLKLGESRGDPEERYQAISAAAVCTRLHLGGEARALDLCQRIKAEPYVKACRATVYQWATSPQKVVAEFRNEDFSAWPESLAAIGYSVRGAAYYNVKNGQEAARDFLKTFQFARSYAKWSALQRLGDTTGTCSTTSSWQRHAIASACPTSVAGGRGSRHESTWALCYCLSSGMTPLCSAWRARRTPADHGRPPC